MKNRSFRFALGGFAVCAALVSGLFLHTGSDSAFADSGTPTPHCGATDLSCVQQFGENRIQLRVDNLNTFIDRVNANTYVTADQKSGLVSDAQTNITGLQALKTKIQGDTDAKTARADVKSIYTDFRIYLLVLPRDHGELWLYDGQYAHGQMLSKESDIQSAIDKAKAAGADVTTAQAKFDDYKAKVDDANTQLSAAQGLIPSLTLANYPATTDTLKMLKADLQAAHLDLKTARQDLKDIIASLKSQKVTPTPTPSA